MGMKFLYNIEPHVSFGCISNVRFHHTSVFSVYEKRARDSYYSPSTPLLTDEHPLSSPGKQNSLPIVSQAAGEEWHGCLTLCALQRKDSRLGHLRQSVSFPASWQPSLGPPLWAGHQNMSSLFPSFWPMRRPRSNPAAACNHSKESYKDNTDKWSSGVPIGDIKWSPAAFWEVQGTSRVPSNQHFYDSVISDQTWQHTFLYDGHDF